MEGSVFRVKEVREEKQCEQETAEEAGPRLFETEKQEFVKPKAPAAAGIELFEALPERFETGVPQADYAPCFRLNSRIASSRPSSVSGYMRSLTSCFITLVDCE